MGLIKIQETSLLPLSRRLGITTLLGQNRQALLEYVEVRRDGLDDEACDGPESRSNWAMAASKQINLERPGLLLAWCRVPTPGTRLRCMPFVLFARSDQSGQIGGCAMQINHGLTAQRTKPAAVGSILVPVMIRFAIVCRACMAYTYT